MFYRLLELFGIDPPDYTGDFPEELQTSAGKLHLHLSQLKIEDKVVATFCRYEAKDESKPVVTFHPEPAKRPNTIRWISIFDRRATELRQRWRECLMAESIRLSKKMRGWAPADLAIETFIQSLELNRLMVSDDGSVSLAFESSAHLSHHDLSVHLSPKNRIKDVAVDG